MRKFLDANIVFETKNKTKEEWLEKRKYSIGGSDAASVVGLNPYKSSMSVYLCKIPCANDAKAVRTYYASNGLESELVAQKPCCAHDAKDLSHDPDTTYQMELGVKLKDFVAREFSIETNKKVRNINGMLKNEKYPFATANIDRAIVGEKAFLMCKVCSSFQKKKWEKEVPLHYKIQAYHYMAVTGATHCYVAVLIGNEKLVTHKVDRDEEMISEIMNLEEKFYNECILGDSLPAPDGSSDYSKVLADIYKNTKNEEIILFEEEKFLDRYDDVISTIKELDTEKKTIEQYIKLQMGEYEIAYLGERKITYKNQSKSVIDTSRLKKEQPELVKEYTKTTTSRVFRI